MPLELTRTPAPRSFAPSLAAAPAAPAIADVASPITLGAADVTPLKTLAMSDVATEIALGAAEVAPFKALAISEVMVATVPAEFDGEAAPPMAAAWKTAKDLAEVGSALTEKTIPVLQWFTGLLIRSV